MVQQNETHLHAEHSHIYFAEGMLRQITYKYNIYTSTVRCRPVQGTGTGPGLNVCWLIKDGLRRSYKAQLPPPT